MLESFLSLSASSPQATALIDAGTGEITTRASLLEHSEHLAARLTASGVYAGDAVAIQLPNSTDFVAAVLAVLRLKLVAVLIDRDAPATEVMSILGQFSVRALICHAERPGVSIVTRYIATRLPIPSAARIIKLTSGSTGMPKGIVVTEANLESDATNICRTMGIGPSDVNLGAIPFSHSYGFSNLITPLILQGTSIVVTNDYLPQALLEHANRYRCTVAPLIPMAFAHLTTAATGSFATVRTFISAGAPLPADTSRGFREKFGREIHSFYGCSECGGISYDRRGAAVERGTVGEALEGVGLSTQRSRLTVRSASVATGYLIDGETFQPFDRRDFITDDIVEMREGELALTGRASDLINTAGKKVNPREVEAVILQIEGVRDARVYGEPAGARGEVVAAAIVATPDVSRDQIREFCRERLSPHKVPRIVKLIDQMPVDERGKVKRAVLATL